MLNRFLVSVLLEMRRTWAENVKAPQSNFMVAIVLWLWRVLYKGPCVGDLVPAGSTIFDIVESLGDRFLVEGSRSLGVVPYWYLAPVPFLVSCLPSSWGWRNYSTTHSFYQDDLPKTQKAKRLWTECFETISQSKVFISQVVSLFVQSNK